MKTAWQDEEQRKSILFIWSGVFINAAVVLTSGMFLTGYLVYLEAPDFMVGLLNNSMNWAAVAGLFSCLIFERLARRKKLLLALLVTSRMLVCGIVYLPLILPGNAAVLRALPLMIITGNLIWGVFDIGYSIWMMNSFAPRVRSGFIFKRMFWLRVAFTLANIMMGFLLDWLEKSYLGFVIVFSFSLLLSLADAAVLLGVKEPDYGTRQHKFSIRSFFEPLRNKVYLKFILFIFLYYTSLTMSSSFTSLYLLRYLELDYKLVSFVNATSNIFLILGTRFWHQVEGRLGLMRSFRLAGLLAVCEYAFYVFLTARTTFLMFPAACLAGACNSGFNVFVVNYRYSIMPETNRTLYEGWYGALYGVALLAGPLIGSQVMQLLPDLSTGLVQHGRFQLLYLLSFVLAVPVLLLAFRQMETRPEPVPLGEETYAD